LAHPYSLAFAWCWAAWLRQLRLEAEQSSALAEASTALCLEHDFKLLELIGSLVAGWATAAQGQVETGLVQIRRRLTDFEHTGAQLGHMHFWVLLTDAELRAGHIKAGLAVVEQALAKLPEKGERFYEAELHRLKGELLLAAWDRLSSLSNSPEWVFPKFGTDPQADRSLIDQAENCFTRAIDIAAGQRLRALELKAALSLARLWSRQGRLSAARDTLAVLTAQFSEGRDTADVQQALALLEKWSSEKK
jgi:predicted ATPase